MPRLCSLLIAVTICALTLVACTRTTPTPTPPPPTPTYHMPGPSVTVTARPMRPASTTNAYQVAASFDDAYDNLAALYNAATTVRHGKSGAGSAVTGAYRFDAVATTKAAHIYAATLSMYISTNTLGATDELKYYAEAADDCGNFATDWPKDLPKTTSYTSAYPNGATGWYTVTVTSAIQEVVNRAGWSATNAMCMIITGTLDLANGEYTYATAWDDNPAQAAVLTIQWDQYTPTPTITPTPTATPTPTVTPTPTDTPTITPTPTATPPCGQILTPTTWSGVYTTTCNIAVPRGITLTIAPGAEIRNGPYKWDVAGALTVLGTPAEPITIHGTTHNLGYWGPLAILPNGRADLEHTTLRDAKALDVAGPTFITSTTIQSNTLGLHLLYPASISGTTILSNTTGLLIRNWTAPTITRTNIADTLVNYQPLTLTISTLYWYTTTTTAIDARITDHMDEYRLGPVIFQPVATEAY